MPEFLHKKVRIEDNRLTSKGRVIANNKIADGITEKNETEESLGGSFWYVFLMPSQPYNYSLFLWINLRNGLFKNLILNLLTAEKKKKQFGLIAV